MCKGILVWRVSEYGWRERFGFGLFTHETIIESGEDGAYVQRLMMLYVKRLTGMSPTQIYSFCQLRLFLITVSNCFLLCTE